MSKELPYFQFEPAEYLTKDISFCSLAVQGLFVNICSYYWQRNCYLTKDQLLKRLNYPREFEELVNENIIHLENGVISIYFLDIQLEKVTKQSKVNSENGAKGGRPKNPIKSEPKPNVKPIESETKGIREDNIILDNRKEYNIKGNNIVYTKDVHACLKICLGYFPEHLHPKKEETWLDVIDKLNNIDKVPFQAICEIVKRTREDKFWGKNFLSLTKLRKTNKDGLKYIIVFNENLKNGKAKSTTSADIDAIIAREMGG